MDLDDNLPYKVRLQKAIQFKLENPTEHATTCARVFHVEPDSLRVALRRKARQPARAKLVGGNNKILSDEQSVAVRQYIEEQLEEGKLGATKRITFALICQLKDQENKPRPSWRWFQTWLKANPAIHTIKAKPMASARLNIHDEETVEQWFVKYRARLKARKIRKGKYVYNFDETGARVGCPKGEEILAPVEVKEFYISSPEDRRTVTVMEAISADGRKPPPPGIIAPGTLVMENWLHENLHGNEMVATSTTGYTNDTIAIGWMKHFIEQTNSGPDKPWKILLMDGHKTHENGDFCILADKNNIEIIYYPSHLTHILQPLDVGVFRPWKHFHNQAILDALQSQDFDYSISSFFRDLPKIREQAFKPSTIQNAFLESGMWPLSCKQTLKWMYKYHKNTATTEVDDDNITLPRLHHTPSTLQESAIALQELADRLYPIMSSPSCRTASYSIKGIKTQLTKAQFTEMDLQQLQGRVQGQIKRKVSSRKGFNC
jgi:hypothetical protein